MATQSISKLNDDLGYDPVIARIFTFTSALEKGEVVDVIELMIYRLWLQQALVSGHAEDVDAKLASLLRITHLDTFDDVEENAERVFARKAEQWTEESRRVDAQLTNLLYNNSSLRERARHTLLDRIETHRKTVPKKFKTFAHLVITLYAIESKAIYDTAAKADKRFDPRNNFQVTVVTWLRLCGGEPKVEHKVNVLLTTSWTSLQDLLTQLTTNVQLEQMGCPNGLSCAHGRWIYKVQDEGITVDDGELTSEEEYNTMKEIAISQGPDQRILIIHVSRPSYPIQTRSSQISITLLQCSIELTTIPIHRSSWTRSNSLWRLIVTPHGTGKIGTVSVPHRASAWVLFHWVFKPAGRVSCSTWLMFALSWTGPDMLTRRA